MQDGDFHPAFVQSCRGFKTQQPAADDHRPTAILGGGEHRVDVIQITVSDNAIQIAAGNRWHKRVRPGCDYQLVVMRRCSVNRRDQTLFAVDVDDGFAFVQGDAACRVPLVAMNDDVFESLLARKHRRQHDAVIIHTWFSVEYGDLIVVLLLVEKLFEHPARRHAVTDDDQLLCHITLPEIASRSFASSKFMRLCCWIPLTGTLFPDPVLAWHHLRNRRGIQAIPVDNRNIGDGSADARVYAALEYRLP